MKLYASPTLVLILSNFHPHTAPAKIDNIDKSDNALQSLKGRHINACPNQFCHYNIQAIRSLDTHVEIKRRVFPGSYIYICTIHINYRAAHPALSKHTTLRTSFNFEIKFSYNNWEENIANRNKCFISYVTYIMQKNFLRSIGTSVIFSFLQIIPQILNINSILLNIAWPNVYMFALLMTLIYTNLSLTIIV